MFEIKEISEVIAERRLSIVGQPDVVVRILLGKPHRPDPSNNNYVLCPHQILGIGDQKVRSAAGVDDFQALQLAMEMIGSVLYFVLNRECGGALRWEAGRSGDLGFPVPPGLEGDIKLKGD